MTVAITVACHAACFHKPCRACSANYHNNFDEREPSNPRNKLAAWKPHVANTGLLVSRHATPKTFRIYTKLLIVNWRSALRCLSKFTARSGLASTASANKAARRGSCIPPQSVTDVPVRASRLLVARPLLQEEHAGATLSKCTLRCCCAVDEHWIDCTAARHRHHCCGLLGTTHSL